MRYNEFLKEKEAMQETWEEMQRAFQDLGAFLKKPELVLCVPPTYQLSLEDTGLEALARNNRPFLIRDEQSECLVRMTRKKQVLCPEKLRYFSCRVRIKEHRYELRFPTVDMEAIQRVKRSHFCDQEQTMMSRASIRVILKNGRCYGKSLNALAHDFYWLKRRAIH